LLPFSQRQAHAGGDAFLRRFLGERPRRQAGQVRAAVLGGLHRDDEGHLVLRAATGLAAAALPAEVGVVDLDAPGELSFGLGLVSCPKTWVATDSGVCYKPRWPNVSCTCQPQPGSLQVRVASKLARRAMGTFALLRRSSSRSYRSITKSRFVVVTGICTRSHAKRTELICYRCMRASESSAP